jgi:uncharacterized secreted protein with C-terminal beta-propeller domain
MRSSRVLSTIAFSTLLAAACTSGSTHHTLPSPSPHETGDPTHGRASAAALMRFSSCRALTDTVRAEALSEVTPFGLPGMNQGYGRAIGGPVFAAEDSVGMAAGAGTTGGGLAAPAPAAAKVAERAAAPAAAPGFSGTNNQEAGVDEPDIVKTNGDLLLVLRRNKQLLEAVDVSGTSPRLLSHLPVSLPSVASLLLSGHTAVVLGQRTEGQRAVTTAEVYDVTDAASMKHLRTFRVTGQLLDARFVHGRIMLVTQSAPALRWVYPGGPRTESESLQQNEAIIRDADAHQWLPSVRVTPQLRTYEAQCDATYHPVKASGISTTSIVTLDPAQDAPTANLTVVGGSNIMYASQSALYLTTASWTDQLTMRDGRDTPVTTQVHGFDITSPDHISTLGSGTVAGTLTDQYALSEDKGYLRVATTLGTPQPPTGEGTTPAKDALSDNRVTVLKPVDGVLTQVGEVRGLGRGQRIYGVRFLGDTGYVVTFRTIDPLYALDLSDPRHPTVKGALHISGYSSALFPLDEGQLLGIGQSVGSHQQQLGAQAEVFDVSDLTHPALTGKLVWPAAMSSAQDDHHALLWWPSEHLVVMPLQSYRDGRATAVVLRVGSGGTLKEIGRVHAPTNAWSAQITRAVVVGDLLYSVTDDGLVVAPLDKVDDQTWLPFA